jgi:hypothetical protein
LADNRKVTLALFVEIITVTGIARRVKFRQHKPESAVRNLNCDGEIPPGRQAMETSTRGDLSPDNSQTQVAWRVPVL